MMVSTSELLHREARQKGLANDKSFFILDHDRDSDGRLLSVVVFEGKPGRKITIPVIRNGDTLLGFEEKPLLEAIEAANSFTPVVHNFSRGERGNGLN
ncbi:MAG: hypothetical protein E6R03_08990 [Hyphomicrobiaceae bacterium]|nr:MAG: hypothetical protein E6R03_08990 [Hyphomicrobiaceae bacterium]